MEQEIRKKAIKRFVEGETPKQIYESLNRSKPWFFKWLRRYQSGDPKWFKGKSRAPKHSPKAIHPEAKKRIVDKRRYLEAQPFAQFGPSAIKWELKKAGHKLPSDSTIKRVLRDEGLVKKTRYIPKGVGYPYFIEPLEVNNIYQADLVGPRYINPNVA